MENNLITITDKDVNPSSVCLVCAKIIAVFNAPYEHDVQAQLGKVADVLNSDCPHAKWIRDAKYMYRPVPFYGSRDLTIDKRAHEVSASLGVSYRIGDTYYWSTTRPLHLVAQDDRANHPGSSRIIDNEWIDLEILRSWIPRCSQHHSSTCEESIWMKGIKPVFPDWLIDVSDACLVPFSDDKKRFLTLSYCWGKTPTLKTTKSSIDLLQIPGKLGSDDIMHQIPETIQNAIDITRCLRERYLWCDSLCIVQDDEHALNRHLDNMHLIYASSFLCIVAQDGRDADHGLRGIRNISKQRSAGQRIIGLAGGEQLTGRDEFRDDTPNFVAENTYRRRAWTFQEFMFSKRRLVFGEGPIRWQCGSAEWYEDLHFNNLIDADHYAPTELWYSGRWLKASVPTLNTLTDVITEFNEKILTYPEDVSRAFAGIHSMLHRVYPGGLIFGLPELYFDIALAWYPTDRPTRRTPSRDFEGNTFQDRLPSWSWMGWHGRTFLPHDLELQTTSSHDCGVIEPVTKWFSIASPQSTDKRPINSQWYEYKRTAQDDTVIPLEGWTRAEYEPPKWLKRRDGSQVPSLPKILPRYSYAHISDPDTKLWYPVPVLQRDKDPELRQQWQYLSCSTRRAFLTAGPDLVNHFYDDYNPQIQDEHGKLVGSIFMGLTKDDRLFDEPTKIELVAIAKGWYKTLRPYARDGPFSSHKTTQSHGNEVTELHSAESMATITIKEDNLSDIDKDDGLALLAEQLPDQQALEPSKIDSTTLATSSGENNDADVGDFDDSWLEHEDSDDEHPEYWKENKEDCYFVLWIEWDGGIAKRKAAGQVLAHAWEKYQENEPVELIMG